jgi:outer membrane protein assembly factor BamA
MDFVNASTSYDSFYGLNGFYYFLLSDMSGAERLAIYTNLVFSFRYTDVMIQYAYLAKRIDYSFALFHFARQFQTINGIFDYRNYGASATMSYPFNKFERVDLNLSFNKFSLSNDLLNESSSYAYLSNLSYTYDNSKWYYFGPIDGMRYTFGIDYAAPLDNKSVSFISAKLDWRHYLEIGGGFAFMNRFSGGSSLGLRKVNGKRVGAEKFRLGGVNYWLFNEKYRSEGNADIVDEPDINNAEELSFSTFITPLRGAYYNEQSGRNYLLYNFEFRFPFIDYFILRVPPIPLQGIRGNFFFDIGSAFDDLDKFRGFKNGNPEDFVIGYGIGVQAFIPFIGGVFRFDTAWRDYGESVSKPIYYFSFGTDL